MIAITITPQPLRTINYTDRKGQQAQLLVQTAYAHVIDQDGNAAPFPEKFEIVLPKGQTSPHAPGSYTLHPSALYVDKDGRLACAPRLTPVKAPAKQAA